MGLHLLYDGSSTGVSQCLSDVHIVIDVADIADYIYIYILHIHCRVLGNMLLKVFEKSVKLIYVFCTAHFCLQVKSLFITSLSSVPAQQNCCNNKSLEQMHFYMTQVLLAILVCLCVCDCLYSIREIEKLGATVQHGLCFNV